MDEKLVSVIMPVYNAKEYLPRSISSVQNQTYKNWELIIVDDGSTDGSSNLVKSYADNDSRIKLISNQHGGTALARNTGIDISQGEYIAFLDADDAYHLHYIEYLISLIYKENADIAVCKLYESNQYENFLKCCQEHKYTTVDADTCMEMLYNGEWELLISSCNKLYARHLFKDIRFPIGKYFEDVAMMHRVLYLSNKTCIANAEMYYYNITPNSWSKTEKSLQLQDRERALRNHWEFFFEKKREDLAYAALALYIIQLISIYYRIKSSDKPDDCKIIKRQFKRIYARYRKYISFTAQQEEEIFKFKHPTMYDLRNMVRADGIGGTIMGFVRRKIDKICK